MYTSLIIGPGAVGSLACAELQRFSQVRVFAHRKSISLATSLEHASTRTTLQWRLEEANERVDVIWVCCKAMHAEASVRSALQHHPDATVVLLHNGLGPQQTLSKTFGSQIIWGSTTCGALPSSGQSFTQSSFGETLIDHAALKANRQYFARLFDTSVRSTLLKPKPVQDMKQRLWQKLMINACINPLTAYYSVRNGVLADPGYQTQIQALLTEILPLMAAEQVLPTEDSMTLVNTVIQASRDNWSSMAQDVYNHRPTEIDFINGFLIEQGQKHGLDTPVLEMWYKRIARLENS